MNFPRRRESLPDASYDLFLVRATILSAREHYYHLMVVVVLDQSLFPNIGRKSRPLTVPEYELPRSHSINTVSKLMADDTGLNCSE